MTQENKTVDISSRRVVTMRDVQDAAPPGPAASSPRANCVITPSARDFLQQRNIHIVTRAAPAQALEQQLRRIAIEEWQQRHTSLAKSAANPRALFHARSRSDQEGDLHRRASKLWMRQFVDGNGGNISYRIGPNEVICTPTLVSKFDLTPDDLCLVDLEGNQVAGRQAAHQRDLSPPRDLQGGPGGESRRALPSAACHGLCHHRQGAAQPGDSRVRGLHRQGGDLSLRDSGNAEFAQTVLPFVKQHNTVLLSNHGIVCWADTVTHAEWYAEVLETYCWTLMLASQLGAPISYISEQKGSDLLAIKKRLGLPDVRFDPSEDEGVPAVGSRSSPLHRAQPDSLRWRRESAPSDADIERLVKSVTDAVMQEIAGR